MGENENPLANTGGIIPKENQYLVKLKPGVDYLVKDISEKSFETILHELLRNFTDEERKNPNKYFEFAEGEAEQKDSKGNSSGKIKNSERI